MEQDISKAMAYQVKREIANRYFGTRKLIEEDRAALEGMISGLRDFYETRLGIDLVRCYSILRRPELIDEFLAIIGWKGRPFYDEYIVESETIRHRLLHDMVSHGWMNQSRFVNLFLDSYRRLYKDAQEYMERLEDVLDELAVLKEEIRMFSDRFALDEIMGFLRTLEAREDLTNILGENVASSQPSNLEAKLKVEPVDALEEAIIRIPALPSPDSISSSLKKLAQRAYKTGKESALKALSHLR